MRFILALSIFCFSPLADEPLSRAERICALTLLAEARGEGKVGLFAVACVVQRRVWERGISPDQVCLEKWQFSPWNTTDIFGNHRFKKETELNYLWDSKEKTYARHLARCLNNKNIILKDITNKSNHFHAIGQKPDYLKNNKPVKIIGNHAFYRLP
tara:strand:- start:4595 stop:5062 length:468 start_codon:yes stop_codon:yes gene_type:complete